MIKGEGMAKIRDEEFAIRPGASFISNKGTPHSFKKNPESVLVKLLGVHGAD